MCISGNVTTVVLLGLFMHAWIECQLALPLGTSQLISHELAGEDKRFFFLEFPARTKAAEGKPKPRCK